MSRLLSSLSKHDGKSFFLQLLLNRCSSQAILDVHLSYRRTHKPQKVEMFTATHLSFEKFHFQLLVSYAISADFESIITPNIQQVNAVSLHEPCGYCYVVIEPDGKSVKPPTVYREIDAAKLFVS
ncbi:hypothetical protein AVEN_160548-1 [Araneus ventricosus]|uniref:Uncharacterized protein n=1 Tax=Araneus ventricosus TaxID=182803 RepID=A0A4Y2PHK1_ARAVE|nr:hypothetical protein AVEN_160548-1 [Araneus ventricosus]